MKQIQTLTSPVKEAEKTIAGIEYEEAEIGTGS